MTPRPARRSGNSTPRRRRASPAATPGATCRSSSARPARGDCPAPTIRSARSLYWGIANPNPYTRLTRPRQRRRGPADVARRALQQLHAWRSMSRPASSSGTTRNCRATIGMPTTTTSAFSCARASIPIPSIVKWISPAIKAGEERDVMVTVAEGGGMFVVEQGTGQFLWARPFPYDDPNINMNDIDVKTGAHQRQSRQAFQEGRRHASSAAITTRAACGDRLSPRQQFALRSVPGSMPVDDGQCEDQGRLGTAQRHHPPRLRSEEIHEHRQDRCRDRRDEGDLLAAAGRPTARRWSPPATWCSGATTIAASARSMPTTARCCGKPSSAAWW